MPAPSTCVPEPVDRSALGRRKAQQSLESVLTSRRMQMTKATSASVRINNGVNVDALMGARTALEQAPEAAQFKWRASCEWVNGTHSRSAIGNFFGLGAERSRGKMFTVDADHPQVFAAEDKAPTPVELVLSGLASCLTA